MISKSQLPALTSREAQGDEIINSEGEGMSDEEQQLELMSDGSCSLRGVSESIEGSASQHDQIYSEEEMDSDGTDSNGSHGGSHGGSHDGAEFTATAEDNDIDPSTAAATTTTDGGGTGTGVKRVKIPGLYKPPTHEELQTLKETQNLFKSNLMRLQVLYNTHYSNDASLV